jgi:CsoR family transcriptional regulator, copper-sensing transcriptional repressor
VDFDSATTSDAVTRLRRIEGQVGGIIRMIESRRECRDVMTQISAASKALDQVGFKLRASGLRQCLADEEAAAADGYSQSELEKLFLKLA